MMAGRVRRARVGTLMLVALLMIASAFLRLGVEAAPALARTMAGDQKGAAQAEDPTETSRSPMPDDLRPLLTAFQDREARLEERESALKDRLKALEIAEQAVDRKLAALEAAEESLKATLALADVAAEDDLTVLTDMYQKMKPKDAAALFEEMEPEFAAGFLARMTPDAAAGIMAGLSPTAAYTISVVLAGRNATVPTE